MNIYNTLTKKVEPFQPLKDKVASIYSCGPTVYDHIHIGNLSAFIMADTLRRALTAHGYSVKHVMNYTDVDDKTIRRSRENYPDLSPEEALQKLTRHYETIFLADMEAIGNDTASVTFVRATEHIADMQALITKLYKDGFAYIADDGVYFSIEKYRASGKTYGQLVELSEESVASARIDNDEYDKASPHDFALWKTRKDNEPAWDFELDGHNLLGRPGWHIECSAMSKSAFGQPFDIHTGGVDLMFPHHENEIAQSTAGEDEVFARYFVHNEHLLVEGRKMSKSLGNFFTLREIQEHGYDPLAFRMMMLQSHYRSQSNFTWEALQAANNRLSALKRMAENCWQATDTGKAANAEIDDTKQHILNALADDLNTPIALAELSKLENAIDTDGLHIDARESFTSFLAWLDGVFGLKLAKIDDITPDQKLLLTERAAAREAKDWAMSDELRSKLAKEGIEVRDSSHGQIWHKL